MNGEISPGVKSRGMSLSYRKESTEPQYKAMLKKSVGYNDYWKIPGQQDASQ